LAPGLALAPRGTAWISALGETRGIETGLLWLRDAQAAEPSENPDWMHPLCQSAVNTPRSVKAGTISTAFTTENVGRGWVYTEGLHGRLPVCFAERLELRPSVLLRGSLPPLPFRGFPPKPSLRQRQAQPGPRRARLPVVGARAPFWFGGASSVSASELDSGGRFAALQSDLASSALLSSPLLVTARCLTRGHRSCCIYGSC